MRVLLYDHVGDPEPAEVVDFDPDLNRWGDIWSVFVPGVGPGQLYHLPGRRPLRSRTRDMRFDGRARLIDPYAKALAGDFLPADRRRSSGRRSAWSSTTSSTGRATATCARALHETVIYEMHVRGFTRDKSSGVSHPGTYLGLIEKIPYLQSLGVTAVELMPVFEFPMNDCLGQTPASGRTTGATIRWRFSRRTAATPSAASRAARSASSRRWCWPCTGRASK